MIFVWVGALSSLEGAERARLNVLLLCIDDLKPVLGCYGDEQVKTPYLDRLASRSMLFEQAYCNLAVCAPSRISLFTGTQPSTLGIYNLSTPFRVAVPDAVSLAGYFLAHGWRTESVGKVMHDKFDHEDPVSWSVPHWYPPGGLAEYVYATAENRLRQSQAREDAAAGLKERRRRGAAVERADVADTAYSDGLIAEETIRRLRAARGHSQQPFFIAAGFIKPHLPFCAPEKYWQLYEREAFVIPKMTHFPEGTPDVALSLSSELDGYAHIPHERPLPEALQRELIHGYYAAVSYMDAQVGRVLDELDRLGLTEQTAIVVWGDHGWHLGDHGLWGKGTNLEEANRIPLIISVPGLTRPGSRTRALAETVDVYPTLADIAGLPLPKGPQPIEGKSLRPVLSQTGHSVKDAVFHSMARTAADGKRVVGHAVRTERYRLVEWKAPGESVASAKIELYDYHADPGESRNLAGSEPHTVASLRSLLAAQPAPRPQVIAKNTVP